MNTNDNFGNINALQGNENAAAEEKVTDDGKQKGGEFKFFKCCSASLKRFSVIVFVISLFFAVTLTGIGVVLIAVYLGTAMLTLLALPMVTLFIILVVIARFISALVYGFAEIVEKSENNK